ncbi:MAG: bifunctional adenosylcobinamide kinase/adenosylcobinamide-phosphate guanylyltransferase [Desulfuromonas sp.]|nr:MAG: bifunctional adenosylcobinamide kinase/adenosylcobinamide-phosphate guanylyltransferase [Desulfuromonas sp.]
MQRIVLITGGARSGKSGFAQRCCEEQAGTLLYVATARCEDDEMAQRIARHRELRSERWQTCEEPLDLAGERLREFASGHGAVMVDCITLWLTNLYFHHGEQSEPVLQAVDDFIASLDQFPAPLFLVTNELGSGIVPENRMARQFRDLAGMVNQKLGCAATEAWLVASGLPLRLK